MNKHVAYGVAVSRLIQIINARIECSQKTLKELRLHREPVGYGNLEVDPFFCWYCHLLFLNRKKCLLFVNVLTKYPVLVADVSRQAIQHFNALLGQSLKPRLYDEGVPHEVIMKFLEHLYRPEISKSKNRSIIGTAVDYERLIRVYLGNSPENSHSITQTEMSLRLSRTPILSLGPDPFPYKLFSAELLKRYGETGHFRFKSVARKPGPLH